MIEKEIILPSRSAYIEHNKYLVEIEPGEFVDLKKVLIENRNLKNKYENAVADYEYEKSKNQDAINYIIKELIEINKHQYAKGSRRLKKILDLLGDSNVVK